jgi:glycosyltransferase involved in cell wall biosynthesis
MRLAITGFVSTQAGSIASANALLLRGLLERGCEIVFFSKASFVDPRPAVGEHPHFRFVDVDNRLADRTRARLQRVPLLNTLSSIVDASSYNRLLVRRIRKSHAEKPFDLCLWLGDYAKAPVPGIPTVSFAQGPPGTDARSLLSRFDEVARLSGSLNACKFAILARLRLSPIGLPNFAASDRFIVGSTQSKRTLQRLFGASADAVTSLPYPIDLALFDLPAEPPKPPAPAPTSPLRCLWLGRIIPRKRLDLFLDAAALVIRSGVDLRLTIVGGIGLVPGYEKLIEAFPFPERLEWIKALPRKEIPALLHRHDLLAQPSDEEDFGSSCAEAQACGLPVIVGATNGNADYLCSRDLHLADDRPETLRCAFTEFARRKREGAWGDPMESRRCAEHYFDRNRVTDQLLATLRESAAASPR